MNPTEASATVVAPGQRGQKTVGLTIVALAGVLSFVMKILAARSLSPHELTNPNRLILQTESAIALTILVPLVVHFYEKRTVASIGISSLTTVNAALAILFFIFGNVVNALIWSMVAGFDLSYYPIRTSDAGTGLEWTSIVFASLGEELVFRGYLIERLTELTRSIWTATIISCSLFALWHYPLWGMKGVVSEGAWGIILSVLFVWRRNLPACMLTHFLTDAFAAGDIAFAFGRLPHSRYIGFGLYFRALPK